MVVGILAATFLANALAANAAFHFAFNTPTQCDDLKFSWTGASIISATCIWSNETCS
jgi:hypothetical protein